MYLSKSDVTTNFRDYREVLKDALLKRQQRNPHYSLRAFARDLNCTYSSVAEVLAKRKGLSTTRAKKIVERLDFSAAEQELFLLSVQKLHARSPHERKSASRELRQKIKSTSTMLSDDHFRLVADWSNYALLEFLAWPEHQSLDRGEIAERMNLPKSLVNDHIDRLLRLNLLQQEKVNGVTKLLPSESESWAVENVSSAARREHHRQLLEKAKESLDLQAATTREFQSIVFSGSMSELAEFKTTLREFVEAWMESREGKVGPDVFSLGLQLFPLHQDKGESQ
jgi:uncharacterized protein (TIGR02147 family)